MLTFSNTTTAGVAGPNATQQPATVSGANPFTAFLWIPTARNMILAGSGNIPSKAYEAARTATTCYYRGLSEHLRIQTSSGAPWIWRRICFKSKDPLMYTPNVNDTGTYRTYLETSNGYQRLFQNITQNNTNNTYNYIMGQLFKGTVGIDFVDFTLAHVDTRVVDLAYDKTTRVSSGNQSGVLREYKRWYPMNKNLVYNDDEAGSAGETATWWSVQDKQGMGNYIVMDIFAPGTGTTSSDLLQISANATLYWHEK